MVGPTGQGRRGFLFTGLTEGRAYLPAEGERELRRRLVRQALDSLATEAG